MSNRINWRLALGICANWLNSVPHGRHVLESRWNARHHVVVSVLRFHIVALWLFAAFHGYTLHDAAVLGVLAPPAAAAWLANQRWLGRGLRSAIASMALLSCAAVLVGLWHGATEAHFDFFVVITLLMLYADWLPFALAIVFV